MPILVNWKDVTPHDNAARRVWRLITPTTDGGRLGAVAGLVAYKPLGSSDAPEGRAQSHGHERPEFIYIISGTGVVHEGEEKFNVKAGDAFVIRPGMAHATWATGSEPLMAFYLAMAEEKPPGLLSRLLGR